MPTKEQMEVFDKVYNSYADQMPSGKQDLAWELILAGETDVEKILRAVAGVGSPMHRPFGRVDHWIWKNEG